MGILDEFLPEREARKQGGGMFSFPEGEGFMGWLRQPSTMAIASGLMSEPDNIGRGLIRGMKLARETISSQREEEEIREQKRRRDEALYGTPWTNPDTGATDQYAGGAISGMDPRQQALARAYPDEFSKASINQMFSEPKSTNPRLNAQFLYPNNPAAQRAYIERVTTMSKAPVVNVATNMPPLEEAYDKTRGEYYATAANELDQAAAKANQNISTLQRLGPALSNPDVYTGTAGEAITGLKRAASSMGVDISGVGDAEIAQAIGNRFALELRNPSGGAGMPGSMSDKDREFLQASVPNLNKSPAGNALLVEWNIRTEQRKLQIAQMARSYEAQNGKLDAGFFAQVDQFAQANPLFTEQDIIAAQQIDRTVPQRPPSVGTPLYDEKTRSLLDQYAPR